MGRPKKALDLERIRLMHEQSFSSVQIAKALGVSQPTVWRVLNSLFKTPSTSKKEPSYSKPIQNSPPIQNPIQNSVHVDKRKDVGEAYSKLPPSSLLPSGTPPSPPPAPLEVPQLDLGKPHHLLFTVAYAGSRPPSLVESHYGKDGCNTASIFDELPYQIQVHSQRIEVWIRDKADPVMGDTSSEMLHRALGRARVILSQFADRHNLAILWKTLERKSEMEITFTDKHEQADAVIQAAIKENPEKALEELGMRAGTASHEDQTHFEGKKGQISFDGLSYAIKKLPGDLGEVKAALEDSKASTAQINEILLNLLKASTANTKAIQALIMREEKS